MNKLIYYSGFTLVELMITIAIAGILSGIAVPGFVDSINNNRMTTQMNELLASLSFAKSEAIKRNRNVSVCKSNSGTTCVGNWHDGWIVFVDSNNDGTFDVGEEILRVHEALTAGSTLSVTGGIVTFVSTGLIEGLAARTITLCDSRGDSSRNGMIITATGQFRQATHTEISDNLASC